MGTYSNGNYSFVLHIFKTSFMRNLLLTKLCIEKCNANEKNENTIMKIFNSQLSQSIQNYENFYAQNRLTFLMQS